MRLQAATTVSSSSSAGPPRQPGTPTSTANGVSAGVATRPHDDSHEPAARMSGGGWIRGLSQVRYGN